MKILVISDIHGSSYYMNKMKERIDIEKPDKIILLGDLYYHGPRNPLTEEYSPAEVAKTLNSLKNIIIAVRGNCDAEVDQMISEFKIEDIYRLGISNKKFIFTHGNKINIDNPPDEDFDVLVYGHFHTGFIKEKSGKIFVNSGSISLPKEDTKNSYLLIDDNNIYLKEINDGIIIDSISFTN